MKSKFAPIVRLKKEALEEVERKLALINQEIFSIQEKIASQQNTLLALDKPSAGDFNLFRQHQLFTTQSRHIINQTKDALSRKAQEQNQAQFELNEALKEYVLKLKNMDFNEFTANFYKSKYTFNPIEKSSYDEIVNFINETQTKIGWYKNNRYPQIIATIYSYIALRSLYSYGMNSALKALFHTLVEIQNSDFFSALGCSSLYKTESQEFLKKSIIAKLKSIQESETQKYKSLIISTDELNFSSMNEFCYSYFTLLKNLNFEEV